MTRKPNGYWPNLENIEREARELIEKHNLEKIPSGIELTKMGESGLSGAISNHYPGGFIGLRKALGEEGIIKSKGYWPNPENIERETGEFMEKHEFDILPNRTKLAEMGESALGSAISKHYPGGFRALRKALGEERIIKSKGYWPNQENIERETREFMEKHEFDILPSENTLGEMGRLDLGNSISRHYPGGFRGLRAALGEERIMKPKGYWPNPENIEREARELIEEHNLERIPSLHKLGEMGRSDIGNAIVTHYPGGFGALRKALGEEKIPKNFNKDLRKLYAQHKQLLEETKGKKRKGKLHYLVGFGKSFENYVGILLALENSEVEHQFKIETKNSFRIIDFVQNSQSYISLEDAIDDLIEVKSGRTLNSHDKSQLEDFLEQGEEITYVVHDRESQLAKSIQIIAEERGIKINIVTPQELETFSRVEGTNLEDVFTNKESYSQFIRTGDRTQLETDLFSIYDWARQIEEIPTEALHEIMEAAYTQDETQKEHVSDNYGIEWKTNQEYCQESLEVFSQEQGRHFDPELAKKKMLSKIKKLEKLKAADSGKLEEYLQREENFRQLEQELDKSIYENSATWALPPAEIMRDKNGGNDIIVIRDEENQERYYELNGSLTTQHKVDEWVEQDRLKECVKDKYFEAGEAIAA